ncbi:MAG: hypothetical protein OJF60_001129 [Burkholderiaceae bacterium]|jgi:cyclopropane-fatty-acyl-phospholipid synthase|nr:MAG: hypothetical protein OJF60_001129 [Burkholderiaceae bacterium]
MGSSALEHSRLAYAADFVIHGLAVALLAGLIGVAGPPSERAAMGALIALGLLSWSLLEYLAHRFVLHGLPPFSVWHAAHHERPTALICTPTAVSAALIVLLVFLPALLLGDRWRAAALTLGVMTGYLGYSCMHHAVHHWRGGGRWMYARQHAHAMHHRRGATGYYGVTTSFWDHVFRTLK